MYESGYTLFLQKKGDTKLYDRLILTDCSKDMELKYCKCCICYILK